VVPPRSNHQKASLILAHFPKQNKGVKVVIWYQMGERESIDKPQGRD
jgi:hypothetical protein